MRRFINDVCWLLGMAIGAVEGLFRKPMV